MACGCGFLVPETISKKLRPMYCLHYIYIPQINRAISEFQESWNNHALSREGAMTPYQLHFEGLNYVLQTFDHSSSSVQDTTIDTSQLVGEHVNVPRNTFVPCVALNQSLDTISPYELTTDHGRTLYNQTTAIVGQHLVSGCDQCIV